MASGAGPAKAKARMTLLIPGKTCWRTAPEFRSTVTSATAS